MDRWALGHTARMSQWVLPIAVPVAILLFITNMANEAGFQEFCRLVARRDGRLKELGEPSSNELDNAFEAEGDVPWSGVGPQSRQVEIHMLSVALPTAEWIQYP